MHLTARGHCQFQPYRTAVKLYTPQRVTDTTAILKKSPLKIFNAGSKTFIFTCNFTTLKTILSNRYCRFGRHTHIRKRRFPDNGCEYTSVRQTLNTANSFRISYPSTTERMPLAVNVDTIAR